VFCCSAFTPSLLFPNFYRDLNKVPKISKKTVGLPYPHFLCAPVASSPLRFRFVVWVTTCPERPFPPFLSFFPFQVNDTFFFLTTIPPPFYFLFTCRDHPSPLISSPIFHLLESPPPPFNSTLTIFHFLITFFFVNPSKIVSPPSI